MALLSPAREVLRGLGRVLLPPLCPLCRTNAPAPGEPACLSCCQRLHPVAEPWCPRCSLPFGGRGPNHSCPRCAASPPPFRRLVAWGRYEGALLEAVKAFKYSSQLHLVEFLAALLLRAYDDAGEGETAAAVPVPCASATLRLRGCDLPALLARRLARVRNLVWRPTALAKAAEVPDLVGLGADERHRAVARAYRPREPLAGTVVLVDDVATSTATARACARACRAAGAQDVWVLVVARTPLAP